MLTPILDTPAVLNVLFHPRTEYDFLGVTGEQVQLVSVTVESNIIVGGRLYPAAVDSPVILYFHGNGEIAADYDDLATLYTQINATLLVMDYRGYGRSNGIPTSSNLLSDAMLIFKALPTIFQQHHLQPRGIYVMGRSLGSVPALEIGVRVGQQIAGLIIESGFADTFALAQRLGLRGIQGNEETAGFGNVRKICQITVPTLIIHGERDILIPPANGEKLYERAAAKRKQLVLIPDAGHNDLMMVGMSEYFAAIATFISNYSQSL